jgi:ribosome-binding protein aMBF1 (putative translation factor)
MKTLNASNESRRKTEKTEDGSNLDIMTAAQDVEAFTTALLPRDLCPSGDQVRTARDLLGWSRQDLAHRTRVSYTLVQRMEAGPARDRPSDESFARIRAVLEAAGVEFTLVSAVSPKSRDRTARRS